MDAETDPRAERTVVREVLSEKEERFERLRRRVGIIAAPVAFFVVYALTAPWLPPDGSRLSGVLGCVLVLWITEALPMPVTAMLGPALCVLLGVTDAKTALAPFADPIIFLFIGSFMLAQAMMRHRLDKRFVLAILSLKPVAKSPLRLLATLGFVAALVSMWVSNTATAAMMLPIALGLLRALDEMRQSEGFPGNRINAADMLLMVAYAASIGGIGTPVGSPPNLIGIGLIRRLAGVDIGFFQWMMLGVSMSAVMYLVLIFLLMGPRAKTSMVFDPSRLRAYLDGERNALGRWTRGQANTLFAFLVTVVLWVTPGILELVLGKEHPVTAALTGHLPEGIAALVGACLLFVLPVDLKAGRFTLDWDEAAQIDWGTILLFGGGLSLGGLMFSKGVAEALSGAITSVLGVESVWSLTAVAIALAIVISETTSNTASANMVIPLIIALALSIGVNPVPPALGACLGSSYGFMLPVSTPPNAIVYGSRLVPIRAMVRAGVLFDIAGFIIIWIGLRVLCPLMGWA
ncbi:SLC13/DASS family transporter [Candidatus Poribacteria bacterium]|nr:SLC13/DASS family transporter [Candidatus Poribacteria bacterium]